MCGRDPSCSVSLLFSSLVCWGFPFFFLSPFFQVFPLAGLTFSPNEMFRHCGSSCGAGLVAFLVSFLFFAVGIVSPVFPRGRISSSLPRIIAICRLGKKAVLFSARRLRRPVLPLDPLVHPSQSTAACLSEPPPLRPL